ncbi:MAG: nucleoside hydrolase [Candidatus Cryptobacteroides sp.]|jgi:inosine-uridine nucleoside N-ribohydrolase
MKKIALSVALLAALLAGCRNDKKEAGSDSDVINIIMETDIGNDVDDALAMDLLYKYLDEGKINLLAVNINKEGQAPAEYVDILNTWYGYPEIPIGVIRDGADCEDDAINYAKAVVMLKDSAGAPAFTRTLQEYDSLPDAHILYRKLLSEAEDHSVVITSVGFSTNLIRLLETSADEYSDLTGKELVAEKVKLLVTMAGNFEDPDFHEYNVVKDIPAAKVIFEEWPTPVVTSPFEIGIKIQYPGSSIENDFGWAPMHPVVEGYKAYQPMPYDRPTWDLTAVLYAVEGESWFKVSPAGEIKVTEAGSTLFTENENGTRRYLSVDAAQADSIKTHFIGMITSIPEKRK